MDLRSVSHSCISSWWRVTQIPVHCASVGSPLTAHWYHHSLHVAALCHVVIVLALIRSLDPSQQYKSILLLEYSTRHGYSFLTPHPSCQRRRC